MSAESHSRRFGQAKGMERAGPVFDPQQALLLDALGRARGGPVSYDELRQAGIEFPASVVSELELAGVPIEHVRRGADGERRAIGVRLRADLAPPGLSDALERTAVPGREQPPIPAPIPEPEPSPEPEPTPEPEPARGPELGPEPVWARLGPQPSPGWTPLRESRTSVARGLVETACAGLLSAGAAGRRIPRTPRMSLVAPVALLATAGIMLAFVMGLKGVATHSRVAVAHRHRAWAAAPLVAAIPRKSHAVAPHAGPLAPRPRRPALRLPAPAHR